MPRPCSPCPVANHEAGPGHITGRRAVACECPLPPRTRLGRVHVDRRLQRRQIRRRQLLVAAAVLDIVDVDVALMIPGHVCIVFGLVRAVDAFPACFFRDRVNDDIINLVNACLVRVVGLKNWMDVTNVRVQLGWIRRIGMGGVVSINSYIRMTFNIPCIDRPICWIRSLRCYPVMPRV